MTLAITIFIVGFVVLGYWLTKLHIEGFRHGLPRRDIVPIWAVFVIPFIWPVVLASAVCAVAVARCRKQDAGGEEVHCDRVPRS